MTKTKSKFKENPFYIVRKEHMVEVWLGVPNDAESEWVHDNIYYSNKR